MSIERSERARLLLTTRAAVTDEEDGVSDEEFVGLREVVEGDRLVVPANKVAGIIRAARVYECDGVVEDLQMAVCKRGDPEIALEYVVECPGVFRGLYGMIRENLCMVAKSPLFGRMEMDAIGAILYGENVPVRDMEREEMMRVVNTAVGDGRMSKKLENVQRRWDAAMARIEEIREGVQRVRKGMESDERRKDEADGSLADIEAEIERVKAEIDEKERILAGFSSIV